MRDEELPSQVVEFVAESPREQALPGKGEFPAADILGANRGAQRTRCFGTEIRKAQAAFFLDRKSVV